MTELIPIFICCVMPVAIVLIVFIAAMNADNKRAAVLSKAIETNNNIDADKLAAAFAKPRKSSREILNGRLLRGCIFSFIGIALLVVGIVNAIQGDDFYADQVTVPLMFGGCSLAVGLSFLVVYFVTRKQVND